LSKKQITLLVLGGGDSAERDVSLESARGMAQAAAEAGHRVLAADPARPDIEPSEDLAPVFGDAVIGEKPPDVSDEGYGARRDFVRILADHRAYGVDMVLNGLHGGAGEDGTIQAVLEYLGVPCTGSGSAACALAMDKHRSKHLGRAMGVPVPNSVYLHRTARDDGSLEAAVRDRLSLPVVVKPNNQGSSVGLTIVASYADLPAAADKAFHLDDYIIVEEYIAGHEITAAMLEGANLPLLEVRPKSGLYDYFHKYQHGATEYVVPAPLDADIAGAISESARRAFYTLGCRAYGRVDFRLGEDGRHYFLEVNTLPGMTSTSLVPKAAKHVGIGYTELVDRILRLSLNR